MSLHPPGEPSLANTPFGPYKLLNLIAAGGMGIVYRAYDPALNTDVAIKLLRLELVGDANALSRFKLEAEAQSKIDHPNVPRVHSFSFEPRPHLVMDCIYGATVADRLSNGIPIPALEALAHAKALASVLGAMHAKGIVHRDLKPGNTALHVSPDSPMPVMKLLDFGIVRQVQAPLTENEGAIGTPRYMAPEQDDRVYAKTLGPEIDVYALGLLLYEMLTGKPLITGATRSERQSERAQVARKLEELPSDIRPLPEDMLLLDKAKRPSAAEVEVRLQQLIDGRNGVPVTAALGNSAATETGPMQGEIRERPRLPRRRALGATGTAVVLVGALASVPLVQSELRKRQTWDRFAEAHALHEHALARLPQLMDEAGATTVLGSPSALIDSLRRRFAAWPKSILDAILLRQEQHEATIERFKIGQTEVTWQNVCDWLNELILLDLVEVRREQTAPGALRYVFDSDGVFLLDLDAAFSGIVFDERTRTFKVRDGFENRPAEGGTWDAADHFCRFYGERLPTGDEWELAGRGTTGRLVPSGEDEHDPPLQCNEAVLDRDPAFADATCKDLHFGSEDVRGRVFLEADAKPRRPDETPEHVKGLSGNVSEYVADRCLSAAEPWTIDTDYRAYRGGSYATEIERGYLTFVACIPRFGQPGTSISAQRGLGWRCAQ